MEDKGPVIKKLLAKQAQLEKEYALISGKKDEYEFKYKELRKIYETKDELIDELKREIRRLKKKFNDCKIELERYKLDLNLEKQKPHQVVDNQPRNEQTKVVYVDKPIEKIVEVPVERIVEVPIERIIEKPVERIIEVPFEKIVEVKVPIEKIIEVPVEIKVPVYDSKERE